MAKQAKVQSRSAQPQTKRKMVGEATTIDRAEQGGKKKKKKADKGLLSFNEAEGDT